MAPILVRQPQFLKKPGLKEVQKTLLAETMQNKKLGKDDFYTSVNLRIVDFELKHAMARNIDFQTLIPLHFNVFGLQHESGFKL